MKKIKLQRFFRNVIKPLIRGVVKSLPLGNVAIEVADNVSAQQAENREISHSWVSIVIQLICICILLYSFFTKQINSDDFINLSKTILND